MKHFDESMNRVQDPEGIIPDEEPVFLLRGNDPASFAALTAYSGYHFDWGMSRERAQGLNEHARRMQEWFRENPEERVRRGEPNLG